MDVAVVATSEVLVALQVGLVGEVSQGSRSGKVTMCRAHRFW